MRRFLIGVRRSFDNGVGMVAVSVLLMAALGYVFLVILRLIR